MNAVIIGGGFYGASIAIHLRKKGFDHVLLIEKEKDLLQRASYNNQARVHNGYHYPRSFVTAFRSRINLPHFVKDYPSCVKKDFTKIYAIPKAHSKINSMQFHRFCVEIGAKIEKAPKEIVSMFDTKRIDSVFQVEEYAFDALKLKEIMIEQLKAAQVEVLLNTTVKNVIAADTIEVHCETQGATKTFLTTHVFNCTYSGLNHSTPHAFRSSIKIKQEIAELALVEAPSIMKNMGVTVMDGPFFSMMPFPAENLHTLSHVRYTPHQFWMDDEQIDPYKKLEAYAKETRVDRMMLDACKYMPAISDSRYVKSLFEIKTVLIGNENDDGRPILFEKHPDIKNFYSILGGKIDNIYDIIERLDRELL